MFVSGKADNINNESPLINVAVFNDEKQENEVASGIYNLIDEQNTASQNELDKQILYVANQIKNLLSEDIFDESINATRKVKFSDIAILSRNRNKTIERFSKVFKEIGIPVNANYKSKLFESASVKLILNYLKVLDNFYQDIPLYSVLNSFIYGLSEEDLINIKLTNDNAKFFYEDVLYFYQNINKINDLSFQTIYNKISMFFDDYNFIINLKETISLPELIKFILNKLKIEEYYEAIENLEEEQNIKMFVEFVLSSGFNSLTELIFYIDNFGTDKTFDKNITDSENAVCLTTIHASKGLEYPIVFIVDMGNKFSNSTMHESLIMDIDLGISTSFTNISTREQKDVPTTKGIKLKKKQFEVQEEMRLLYVALTRAKNKLYLVGETKLDKIKELGTGVDILSRNSYYSWILGLLNSNQLDALIKNGNLTVNYNGSKINFTIENVNTECEGEQEIEAKGDFNTQIISNYLHYMPLKSAEKLRYTVTEILQGEEQNKINYVYKLDNNEQEIDYSHIGTIYHSIMQKINFESLSFMECKKEIPKLINMYKKELSENETIDEKQIETAVYNLGELLQKNDKVYKELGFHLYSKASELNVGKTENKVAVQGVVDLIIERDNEIIVLDYKTSRLKNENDFIKKYKNQLELYAKAVSKYFKKPVSKKIIYSFYLNRLIFV